MTKISHTDSENKIIISAFTQNGINLALRLSNYFDVKIFVPERFKDSKLNIIEGNLSEWTGKYFHKAKALIFIGACGIAVRAIAEHVKSKLEDPAVIVIDEAGKFVIPILSGHVGGANELSLKIANFINAVPVITTATDVNNLVAVDEWAVKNDCVIENPEAVKIISGAVLEHKNIGIAVTEQNQITPFPITLYLRPKNLILGTGCNRGTDINEFENAALRFLNEAGVSILSLKALASIDIKSNEPALIKFAENHKIPFLTFSAKELSELEGNFTKSERVLKVTGVDNVCERACIKAGGEGTVLMRSKIICGGITLALARMINVS
ncbi:MAG: cobalt-precorrin 5A hydrolase [Synergistaceae bacterium]|nr:cobalt-precorrin 5A hydrolase [Synergistaceae bacterium]